MFDVSAFAGSQTCAVAAMMSAVYLPGAATDFKLRYTRRYVFVVAALMLGNAGSTAASLDVT